MANGEDRLVSLYIAERERLIDLWGGMKAPNEIMPDGLSVES